MGCIPFLFLIKTGTNVLQKNGVSKHIRNCDRAQPGKIQPYVIYLSCIFSPEQKWDLAGRVLCCLKNNKQIHNKTACLHYLTILTIKTTFVFFEFKLLPCTCLFITSFCFYMLLVSVLPPYGTPRPVYGSRAGKISGLN